MSVNILSLYNNNKDIRVIMDSLLNDPEFVKKHIVQLFSTRKYCKDYDICNDEYESDEERISTNEKYPNFFQKIFHAGDKEQFFRYASIPYNIPESIRHEFNYMFDILKKGIYVYIKKGIIKTFLPFSNNNYTNDWGQYLRVRNGSFSDVLLLEEKNHWNHSKDPKYSTAIEKNPNKWYSNNCIFRNTKYVNGELKGMSDEGDKSIVNFLELLTELCYERDIADVCFFVNPRDFPVLKKDRHHPYDRLYKNGGELPFYGFKYRIIDEIPIFSQSISSIYDDQLLPNDDDIISLLCDKKELYNTKWQTKIAKAVFRGSATGCGTLPKNNQRLKLYEIAKGNKLMDVKLIGLNKKIKVDEDGYVAIIDESKYPRMNKNYKDANSLSPKEQSKYKYIIHVQGHVAAFRLTRELSYGSLILKVNSEWKTWYSDLLIGYKIGQSTELRDKAHYIVIKSDMSDLKEAIEWCTKNDDICKSIAERSLDFYRKHFSNKEYMFDYMQKKLNHYSQVQSKLED